MITVYHADGRKNQTIATELMMGEVNVVRYAFSTGMYQKVATVDSDDLEFAWRHTNNVDDSWSQDLNPGVTVEAPLHEVNGKRYGLRSSMMGDVFFKDGEAYVVARCGFMRILVQEPK